MRNERGGLCECGCGKPTPVCQFTDANRGYVKGQPHKFVAGHKLSPKQSNTPEWRAAWAARDRCTNPKNSHTVLRHLRQVGVRIRTLSESTKLAMARPHVRKKFLSVMASAEQRAKYSRARRRSVGMGLVELMVCCVVGLILLCAVVPSQVKVLRATQQRLAIEAMREISASESYYIQRYSNGYQTPAILAGNGVALSGGGSCDFPTLLYPRFAQAQIGHYTFVYTPVGTTTLMTGCTHVGANNFTLTASPTDGFAGTRYFYIDGSAVLRFADGTPATISSAVWAW